MSTSFRPGHRASHEAGRRHRRRGLAGCALLIVIGRALCSRALVSRRRARPPMRHRRRSMSSSPGRRRSVRIWCCPGETAAWYETTIYARVNGYVAKWLVDIGDHVKKGQVLATIETPELDAELQAARAQLKASRGAGAGPQGGSRVQQNHQRALARFAERRGVRAGARIEEGGLRKRRGALCMRPMRRSLWTNPRSINTAPWRNSNKSRRPSTAPSPSARSMSAIW